MSFFEDVLKLVILGEFHVGKTSILLQYFQNKFNERQNSIENPSFFEKRVKYNGINV